VLVNPSIWEYDGDLGAFNQWQQLMLDAHPTGVASSRSADGASRSTEVVEQGDTARSNQALQIANLNPQLRALQDVSDKSGSNSDLVREARERQARAKLAQLDADTTAMQLIPRPLLPFHDRYIGTISKTPALGLLSTSLAGKVSVTFKEPEMVPLVEGGPPRQAAGGDYRLYVAIVPAR
jgi:hypothetical protein